jgi:hypothetical protein
MRSCKSLSRMVPIRPPLDRFQAHRDTEETGREAPASAVGFMTLVTDQLITSGYWHPERNLTPACVG